MIQQVLREWPPGFGGVERVAHELASVWCEDVFSLDAQPESRLEQDPLPVHYRRLRLARIQVGRLLLPLPSLLLWRLLRSSQPLHGHLPSPAVLLILLSARLLKPRRTVTAHWHCFLEPSSGINGRLFGVYQKLALALLPFLSGVITTSPLLRDELILCGCASEKVHVLPCCLSELQESEALLMPIREASPEGALRVIFIGRLDSYKRLDWLLQALAELRSPWQLVVVGDGPRREAFEALAQQLFAGSNQRVIFRGRLDERAKAHCLEEAEVLVLPSDRSNEAFGIVQLEAMAAGKPALAFHLERSGMGWVGRLPELRWSQRPRELAAVLQMLASNPGLRQRLGEQSRVRYKKCFSRLVWLERMSSLSSLQ